VPGQLLGFEAERLARIQRYQFSHLLPLSSLSPPKEL